MKIRVTGGYVGELSLLVKDHKGSDLSTAGLKMLLLGVGVALPVRASSLWLSPTAAQYWAAGAGEWADEYSRARITLVISEATYPGGKYHAYVLAALSPLAVPVLCENEVIELV